MLHKEVSKGMPLLGVPSCQLFTAIDFECPGTGQRMTGKTKPPTNRD